GLQRELDAAVRAAGDTLRTSGHAADDTTLRRMQEILRLAAVTGGETWDNLAAGALIEEPQAGEDMLTAAFAVGAGGPSAGKAPDRGAARATASEVAEMEMQMALEHAIRTAKQDEEAAQQADQTATRLRDEAMRMAADAKRASEKAKAAEKQAEQAAARAKASSDALRRLRR
ncbi:MAG: hypothetical protein M3077_12330, partial [Candidatus Dormibacteraeota bacterium]|nr:hypothetical protein [Candidatus Dormibacteraeota bacterium]